MWIFGYGSLVWKVDFPYEEKVVGYIKGYSRRFWQASVDHRGIPEKPGRVVTLVKSEDPETKVWGCAYRINESLVQEDGRLNQREQKYTERLLLPVFTRDDNELSKPALVFIGTDDPKLQLGPASLLDMAIQISNAEGPSGHNSEYLFNLAKFLREETPMSSDDDNEDCVWGVAYNISQEQKKDVLIYLDYREKGGYERTHVMFHPKDTNMKPWMLMIYVGTTDNPFYRGPADDDAVASIIAESVGPSGSNAEYLLNLFVAMDAIGGLDDHLRNLQEKVQNLKRLKI